MKKNLPTTLGEQIQFFREFGLTYNEIQKRLSCSKSTISYHLDINGKDKVNMRLRKNRAKRKRYLHNMFARNTYYSQTQIIKQFKISAKQLKELLSSKNIPVISKSVDLGEYSVDAMYITKEAIDKLNLQLRPPKK